MYPKGKIFRRGFVGAAACPARLVAIIEQKKSTQGLTGQRKSLPLEGKAVRLQPDRMRPKAADLGTLPHEAVQKIGGKYQEAELPDLGENEKIGSSIPADPNVKNFSYTIVDGGVY